MADGRGCWSCLGWRWPRPPPGAGAAADPPAERAPLVLCPGVCGTQLGVRPAGTTGDGERCWVTLASSDVNYKRLRGRYSAETGRVELLTPGFEVAIPQGQDASGLYAISVLDPDLALPAVHYFEPLIAFLQGQGYAPGVDLFGAGYDFRQSCRFNACALLARLQEVSRRCGGRRVDIVTHSMGGLVVRSLLADFPAEFEALVGRWVAIGCPFGGAPGYTVDALLTGVQFGGSLGDYFFVQRGTFLQARWGHGLACLQSPAIYELLPPLDFPFAHPPPQLTLWLKEPIPPPPQGQQAGGAGAGEAAGAPLPCVAHQQVTVNPQAAAAAAAAAVQGTAELAAGSSGAGTTTTTNSAALASSGGLLTAQQYVFRHEHLPGLLARLFRDNAVAVGGASVALPFNQELWALGQATHASWAAARLPRSCRFFNVLGTGTSTPYDAQYGAWWYPLQNLEGVPHANADFTYVDGDGTVPAESSAAHGLGAAGSAAVGASHRGLAVFALLLQWLQEPLTERGPREERATPSAAAPAADGLRAPLLGDGQEGAAAVPGEDLSNPLVWHHARLLKAQRPRLRRAAAPAAPRAALALPAVALVVSKAVAAGVAVAWARAAVRSLAASLAELFCFSPARLRLQYLPGTGETGPLEARRYTLTHSDRTGVLQLSIGKDWHAPQLAGWYKALLRDEVLAEWRGAAAAAVINASAGGLRRLDRAAGGGAGSGGPQPSAPVLPSLHIYCHVSTAWEVARGAARLPWPPAPPHLRARIFEKDMPIVLAALAYAERHLLAASPLLAAAPVHVHLRSHRAELNRVVPWGRFGDPASWRPQGCLPAAPAAVPAQLP